MLDDINRTSSRVVVRISRYQSRRCRVDLGPEFRRRSHHQQPGRERPRNRPWGQGPGSAGGVAHVPAALRRRSFTRRKTPRDRVPLLTRQLSAT